MSFILGPIAGGLQIMSKYIAIGKHPAFTKGAQAMIYTFSCPAPCRRVIRVDARNDDVAVGKLIKAGAMTCRNRASDNTCDTTRPVMSPWTDVQLRGVVRLIMRAEELPEMESRNRAQEYVTLEPGFNVSRRI
jgi:hypothetical protein